MPSTPLSFDAMYSLAQYKGWELETLPSYAIDEPPTYVLSRINGPYACSFQTLERVAKFLTTDESE
jgi:hypothetical protein